jgi:hypothetical protein
VKTYRFCTRQTLDVQYIIQLPDDVELREEELFWNLEKYTEMAVDVDFLSQDEDYERGTLHRNDKTVKRKKREG